MRGEGFAGFVGVGVEGEPVVGVVGAVAVAGLDLPVVPVEPDPAGVDAAATSATAPAESAAAARPRAATEAKRLHTRLLTAVKGSHNGGASRWGRLPALMPLAAQPRKRLAVLTCMDARIDPLSILGLELGDAHIIRNAGGLVTQDAIRSLSASQRLLGTRKIALVMHSGCGLCGASDDEFNSLLASDGAAPDWRLGAFQSVTEALLLGVARLRASRELPHRDDIQAFIFDTDSGVLHAPELIEGASG